MRFDHFEIVRRNLQDSGALKTALSSDENFVLSVQELTARIVDVYKARCRVFMCGNGGSAADAQHFSAELSGHYLIDRLPLAADVLHGNPSHVTAVSNDYSYEQAFARALEASARPGDLLVAISTSGSSRSVVEAVKTARRIGVFTAAMTGEGGGELAELADLLIAVPAKHVGRTQEVHGVLLHAVSEGVEKELFG